MPVQFIHVWKLFLLYNQSFSNLPILWMMIDVECAKEKKEREKKIVRSYYIQWYIYCLALHIYLCMFFYLYYIATQSSWWERWDDVWHTRTTMHNPWTWQTTPHKMRTITLNNFTRANTHTQQLLLLSVCDNNAIKWNNLTVICVCVHVLL